jgi:hypothetical protein
MKNTTTRQSHQILVSNFYILFLLSFVLGCVQTQKKDAIQGSAQQKKQIIDENVLGSKGGLQQVRKRIVVLPFIDQKEERLKTWQENSRDKFIREVNFQQKLIALDSAELNFDPRLFLKNGEYNLSEMSKKAKDLGVSAILEGRLVDIKIKRQTPEVGLIRQLQTQFDCIAQIRMVSVRTGVEIFNVIKTVTIEDTNVRIAEKIQADKFFVDNPELLEKLVQEAFLDFVPQVELALDRVGWEGRIAMINGDRIYLNVGQMSGVQLGDLLKVSDSEDEIYDPHTGNFIGKVSGRLKGTLEVVSYFGKDGAIAVIHSGAGFKETDRVEFYQ